MADPAEHEALGALEVVHLFDGPMPTGVSVTRTGRVFVCYPKWGDDVRFTVGELRDGKVVAFPDARSLVSLMGRAGLTDISYHLLGAGTVALHVGHKPA